MGQRLVQLRPGPTLEGEYLLGLIYSKQIQQQIHQLTAGTTNPHLNVAQIRRLKIVVPPPEIQHRAVQALSASRLRIDGEKSYRSGLVDIRRGLAADLLSGRVRAVAT
jgi:type I restriction enzyme S subunit